MAVSTITHLTEGLTLDFDGERMSVTVPYHVKDLEELSGGTNDPVMRLAAALRAPDVPIPGTKITIEGRELFSRKYRLGAWSVADAEVIVTYVENITSFGGSTTEIEVGTTTELGESDFDAANQIKPFIEREAMFVLWEKGRQGAPVDGGSGVQKVGVRLPTYIGKPFRRYTKVLSDDPGPMSEIYVSRVNNATWKGYPAETVLCLSIIGSNTGSGWRTSFDFAIDREAKWRQVFRVTDTETGEFVPVTVAQAAAGNGIKDFLMQPTQDFSALPI